MDPEIANMSSPLQFPSEDAGDGTTSPKRVTYSDPSAIFSMYITRALRFDRNNVANWRDSAGNALVFIGLFTSTVATFISISYPTLHQDPNLTTHFLLAQISQQLSNANTNHTSNSPGLSIQPPFSPSASVVFVNSVWFVSLVLSLICALLATLLQQWARRYLDIVEQNHPPYIRAHIREHFYQGVRESVVFGIIDLLPFLFSASVFLFFAGLVVFAFLANQTVAYFTLTIIGIFSLWYLFLTLKPLLFHEYPYDTPPTRILLFSAQKIALSFSSVLYHGAKYLHKYLGGLVSERKVKLCRYMYESKVKSWSEDVISKLANSASSKSISMDRYKTAFTWTLHQLDQDHELEEFVAGIPGLYESEAFSRVDEDDGNGDDVLRGLGTALAVLPGPTSSDKPLPWSIIRLAQVAITSDLSWPIQQKRTQACLRALYYIPGAIRDVLAPYAARKYFYLEILPLFNSPESLKIINELWDSPNDDVALSVRCAAAVVAAFMITPPRVTLDIFVSPTDGFIGDSNAGKQFLDRRLRIQEGGVAPDFLPNSDTARLQNIVRFLEDIQDTPHIMNTQWWASDDSAESIHGERKELYDKRHTEGFLQGYGRFDQQGNRTSPAFVPAAQQDLIVLTLEILARDDVADAATSQREAFHDVYTRLEKEARELVVLDSQERQLVNLSRRSVEAEDRLWMVKRALEPVFLSLSQSQNATPHAGPHQMPVPQIMTLAPRPTRSTDDTPGPRQARPSQRPQPPPIQAPPYMFQYSLPSPAGLATAVGDLGNSPVWGSSVPVAE